MCYKLPDSCIGRRYTGDLMHYPAAGRKVTIPSHFITGTVVARKLCVGGMLILIREDPQSWHARYPSSAYRCIWHADRGPCGVLYRGTDKEADAFVEEHFLRFEAEVNSAMAL